MKRKDYKNFVWYPVTDETYWAEEYPDEFPGCQTIIRDKKCTFNLLPRIMTRYEHSLGWGSMTKYNEQYELEFEFMIIDNSLK